MTNFFKKIQKHLFGPIFPKFGQKWIYLKKGLSHFLNIPIIYHHTQNQKKKTMSHSWEKCQTDRWTDRKNRHTDRQPWFYRTLQRTGVQKCKFARKFLEITRRYFYTTLRWNNFVHKSSLRFPFNTILSN